MNNLTLKINSEISKIKEVEKFIEDICDYYNLNNTYYGNIIVAVSEAVENAMQHGNKFNPQKEITITFEKTKKGLIFIVEDQGNGFNVNDVPDATDIKTNPEKKGIGIYLMKTLSDEMYYTNGGKKVQMIFYTSSISKEIYLKRKRNIEEYYKIKKEIKEKNK